MLRPPFVVATLFLTTAFSSLGAPKESLAVANFTWEAVHSDLYRVLGSEDQIRRSIRNRLITWLVRGNQVTIVEGEDLQRAVDEQNRAMTDRSLTAQRPRMGRVPGVGLYLVGTITVFGLDPGRHLGDGRFSRPIWSCTPSGQRVKLVVAIDYRLVDAATNEIVGAGEARGESERFRRGPGDAIDRLALVGDSGIDSRPFRTNHDGEGDDELPGEARDDARYRLGAVASAALITTPASLR